MARLTIVPEHLREADVTFLFSEGSDPSIRALFASKDSIFELKHLRFKLSEYMDQLRSWCEKDIDQWELVMQKMDTKNYEYSDENDLSD